MEDVSIQQMFAEGKNFTAKKKNIIIQVSKSIELNFICLIIQLAVEKTC